MPIGLREIRRRLEEISAVENDDHWRGVWGYPARIFDEEVWQDFWAELDGIENGKKKKD